MKLIPRHNKFVNEYLSCLNASEAYRRVYGDSTTVDSKSAKLMARDDIKQVIASKLDALSEITEQEYIRKTKQLHENEKNSSVKARYWELLGKVKGFTKETIENKQVTNIIDYSKIIDKLKDSRVKRCEP